MENIKEIVDAQRAYFRTNATLSLSFREQMLKRLRASIISFEKELCDALYKDLHKSLTASLSLISIP